MLQLVTTAEPFRLKGPVLNIQERVFAFAWGKNGGVVNLVLRLWQSQASRVNRRPIPDDVRADLQALIHRIGEDGAKYSPASAAIAVREFLEKAGFAL
jgi:hypothetical protein